MFSFGKKLIFNADIQGLKVFNLNKNITKGNILKLVLNKKKNFLNDYKFFLEFFF